MNKKSSNKNLHKASVAKRGEEALTSQLIPLDKKMWEINNYQQFLSYRRNAIAEAINNFMKKYE